MQDTLKREQKKAKLAQDDLRENIRNLEAELGKQRDEIVKNLEVMKEVGGNYEGLLLAFEFFQICLSVGKSYC